MHPQMQQVFISQIREIFKEAQAENVYIQAIITTHSSHILAETGLEQEIGFNRIRYFNRIDDTLLCQDFNNLKVKDEAKTFRFLKQYLTLHKSDLFFADKVIMVEGTTERMLLPQMILKSAPSLASEYITILEIGGAFAANFKELLNFLAVKTLIITDIDSVDEKTGKECPVNEGKKGEKTSNECLKSWIPNRDSISDLLSLSEQEKIKGNVRVAYQIKENNFCPRSFESSYICSNMNLLQGSTKDTSLDTPKDIIHKNLFSYFKVQKEVIISDFPKGSKSKTKFAFDIMTFEEGKFGNWNVPRYIDEGLKWLAKN